MKTLFGAFCFLFGCAEVRTVKDIKECISQAKLSYDDTCAESSSGYEHMTRVGAHYDGVKCGAEFVRMCLEIDSH